MRRSLAGRDERGGIERIDVAGGMRPCGARVERAHRTVRALPAEQPTFERGRADAESRNAAESGDGQVVPRRRYHDGCTLSY